MLNRPATKIDLKLEEDMKEYEDTVELRNNLTKNSDNKGEYEIVLTPESYKNQDFYHDSNVQFSITKTSYYGLDTPNNKN